MLTHQLSGHGILPVEQDGRLIDFDQTISKGGNDIAAIQESSKNQSMECWFLLG
jgi:hypothetical protein